MLEFRLGYIVRPISKNIYRYTRTFNKYSPLLCTFTNFQPSIHSLDPWSETSLKGNKVSLILQHVVLLRQNSKFCLHNKL